MCDSLPLTPDLATPLPTSWPKRLAYRRYGMKKLRHCHPVYAVGTLTLRGWAKLHMVQWGWYLVHPCTLLVLHFLYFSFLFLVFLLWCFTTVKPWPARRSFGRLCHVCYCVVLSMYQLQQAAKMCYIMKVYEDFWRFQIAQLTISVTQDHYKGVNRYTTRDVL